MNTITCSCCGRGAVFLLAAGAALGQSAKVIPLPAGDVAALRAIYERKAQADRDWNAALRSISKYATVATTATAGAKSVTVYNPLPGWEWGALLSEDLAFLTPAPKPEPLKPECPVYESERTYTSDTIPAKPWLVPEP
jgi:hypothetical protein